MAHRQLPKDLERIPTKPEKDGPVEVQVWHPTGAASNSLHKNSSLEHLQDKCESEARCLHMCVSPADLLEANE